MKNTQASLFHQENDTCLTLNLGDFKKYITADSVNLGETRFRFFFFLAGVFSVPSGSEITCGLGTSRKSSGTLIAGRKMFIS